MDNGIRFKYKKTIVFCKMHYIKKLDDNLYFVLTAKDGNYFIIYIK